MNDGYNEKMPQNVTNICIILWWRKVIFRCENPDNKNMAQMYNIFISLVFVLIMIIIEIIITHSI